MTEVLGISVVPISRTFVFRVQEAGKLYGDVHAPEKQESAQSVSLLATWVVCLGARTLYAADPAPQAYKIEPQSVSTALKAFAAQSNMQLIFTEADVGSAKSNGVSGTKAPREALSEILKGTGLKFEFTANNVVVVKKLSRAVKSDPPSSGDQGAQDKGGKPGSSQDFRVSQLDQANAGPQALGDDQNSDKKKKKEEGLSEIVVTGSRIPTVAGNEVQPVRSYTREDIENSGQFTMGEFLNTLPDVSTITNPTVSLSGFIGGQTVPASWAPRRYDQLTFTRCGGGWRTILRASSISAIFRWRRSSGLRFYRWARQRSMARQRIGWSSQYKFFGRILTGSEANVGLEKAPGVSNPSANLAWGKSWDRGSVSIIGNYRETGALLECCSEEPWSSTSLPANLPESTILALGSDSCAPGNVYSVDGSNLPGLSSPFAGIPAGITGRPTIGQFAATAGKQNICNVERYVDITPESQREGVLLSAHYGDAESVDLFSQVLYSHQHLQNQLAPQIQEYPGSCLRLITRLTIRLSEAVPEREFRLSGAYAGTQEVESTSLIRPMIGVRGSSVLGLALRSLTSLSF